MEVVFRDHDTGVSSVVNTTAGSIVDATLRGMHLNRDFTVRATPRPLLRLNKRLTRWAGTGYPVWHPFG